MGARNTALDFSTTHIHGVSSDQLGRLIVSLVSLGLPLCETEQSLRFAYRSLLKTGQIEAQLVLFRQCQGMSRTMGYACVLSACQTFKAEPTIGCG